MFEVGSVEKFISFLQKSRKSRNLVCALSVHSHICNNGLEAHISMGNYIVPMFVECGNVSAAQQVFNRLVHPNEHSWTSLILGYVQHGQSCHAVSLYQEMRGSSILPSRYTLLALLKACCRLKDLQRGRQIHGEIADKGFGNDIFVGSSLVDMYAKCGSIREAQKVFDQLPNRNTVSWNTLIAGYAEVGAGQEALKCYEQMQLEGIIPDAITFVCMLKASACIGAVDAGREIHMALMKKGFERDISVANTLIDMYAKRGCLSEAQEVFNKLPVRDVVSWTALIGGYAEHGAGQEALKCFEQMQFEGIYPNAVTFVCSLKACSKIGALCKGQEIHAELTKKGLEKDLHVGSSLIDMYAKCGSLLEARKVFENLPLRNVVIWNALIAGYAEHGPHHEAFELFEQMKLEGVDPDATTFVCIAKACGSIGALENGREIHAEIVQRGFERDFFVCNSLVNMYAKCKSLSEGRQFFEKLPARDIMLWNTLIAGYAEHGPELEAFKCFEQMQLEGFAPDATTFVCILKACGSIRDIERGREMHKQVNEKGFETEIIVGNSLVDMYAKCGSLLEAYEVFDRLPTRDVVSWNALIAGYAEHGLYQEALRSFEQMPSGGISPNVITFICAVKACTGIRAVDKGQELHADAIQKGFERDPLLGNTLIDMYAKCGLLEKAEEVFNKLTVRSVVSWTTLIAGYAEHGPWQKALTCIEQMQMEGVEPDAVTLMCGLKACGSIGAINKGQEIHAKIMWKGFERDLAVGSSLVDMYARCGLLSEAREVFNKLPKHDVVSWSAMINGYGMNHEGHLAVECFDDLQRQGVKPDAVTFTCLLTACSRANLVFKGQEYLKVMIKEYGIIPTMDHYTCMVDLLARSGHLFEASTLLETLPFPASLEMWTALLSACKTYGESELGSRCFQQLVQMSAENATPYVLMGDIYATTGSRDDAARIDETRKHAGAKKKPASALIEVDGKVHEFVVGFNDSKQISAMLEILSVRMKEEGYVPSLEPFLSISDDDKEAALCEHAEKLAVAFGLLNTPRGQSLHVNKNMKMCNNCHNANRLISRIEGRQIIIRDGYCLHHFKDGLCSCIIPL